MVVTYDRDKVTNVKPTMADKKRPYKLPFPVSCVCMPNYTGRATDISLNSNQNDRKSQIGVDSNIPSLTKQRKWVGSICTYESGGVFISKIEKVPRDVRSENREST